MATNAGLMNGPVKLNTIQCNATKTQTSALQNFVRPSVLAPCWIVDIALVADLLDNTLLNLKVLCLVCLTYRYGTVSRWSASEAIPKTRCGLCCACGQFGSGRCIAMHRETCVVAPL